MRYKDFKIVESMVGAANVSSIPKYIDAINSILQSPNPTFLMGAKGNFSFTANPGQQVNSIQGALAGKGQNHIGKDVDPAL